MRAQVDWLEHQFTPESYVDLVEHWTEDDVFARLDDAGRADVRRRLLKTAAAPRSRGTALAATVDQRGGAGTRTRRPDTDAKSLAFRVTSVSR